MNEIEQLLTIAEVSVALAGFAGIVATFQFRQQVNVNRGHALALSMIVNISLVGALFAVLPMVFINYGIAEEDVWPICSALMGINISIFIFYVWRTTRLNSLPFKTRIIFSSFFVVAFAIVCANFMNSVGLVFENQFGTYFISFVFCFFLVGYNFSRLLMLPLWKQIHRQEVVS